MELTMSKHINVHELIKRESIKMLFQPIVSTYYDQVSGVEALVRGIDPDSGEWISPFQLFEAAKEQEMVIQLDRLCQRKAIQAFSSRKLNQKELILFLNVDNSVIHLDDNTDAIYHYCLLYGVSPESVVLEINELHSAKMDAVIAFSERYRSYGFMISIDDIGAGYSNLDRIVLLKPDIVKIDMELIRDIHQHYHKQQVVEMIIRMSEKVGAIVVAEGVELLEEVVIVLQFGAQLLQGYYISKPLDMESETLESIEVVIDDIALAQKSHLEKYLANKCYVNQNLRDVFTQFVYNMSGLKFTRIREALKTIMKDYPKVECAYVIDEEGYQLSDTIFFEGYNHKNQKSLFRPYNKGDDATLKAYYYVLKTTNQPVYISDEYISLATGHRCITISGYCQLETMKVIICLDIVL